MKISTRIILSSLIFIITLCSVFYLGYYTSNLAINDMSKMEHEQIPLIKSIESLEITMLMHRRYEKDLILNIGDTEKQKEYLASFKKQNEHMYAEISKAEEIIVKDMQNYGILIQEINNIKENIQIYIEGVNSVGQFIIANQDITPQDANKMIAEFKDETYNIEASLLTLEKEIFKIVAFLIEKQTSELKSVHTKSISIMCAGSFTVLLVMLLTYISIMRPLHSLIAYANELQEGNYDVQAKGTFSAEMKTLATTLIAMAQNLKSEMTSAKNEAENARKALEQVQKTTEEAEKADRKAKEEAKKRMDHLINTAHQLENVVAGLASASEQLSSQIELSSHGAQEQASRITEAATAMEEMNCTTVEVAKNSSVSAEIADNTKNKALEGSKITQECKESILAIREESISLRSNMNILAEHAQSINTIMGVISDIADQTNLLALNAAIEAARAGDAGRGFAVVADEVRKLAEKTMTSTLEVSNVIRAIQASTETNVHQVDIAVQGIEEASNLANQCGDALHGILEMADASADGIHAIATASEEQSSTTEEIVKNISLVNNLATENNSAMREASQAVNELAKQSQELARLIEDLKQG